MYEGEKRKTGFVVKNDEAFSFSRTFQPPEGGVDMVHMLTETDQLSSVRESVFREVKLDKRSREACAVGEIIKNSLWGQKAYVFALRLGSVKLLLTISRKGKAKIDRNVNGEICLMEEHTVEDTHGFGTEIINGALNRPPLKLDLKRYFVTVAVLP